MLGKHFSAGETKPYSKPFAIAFEDDLVAFEADLEVIALQIEGFLQGHKIEVLMTSFVKKPDAVDFIGFFCTEGVDHGDVFQVDKL